MIFIHIATPPNLPSHWNKIYLGRIAKVRELTSQELRSKYIKSHGSWGRLKKWLSILSCDKCWYCEAKSTRAPFDVDHFRPKLGITIDRVGLTGHDGYYWLAYEWCNFRLSCQRCNRPENSEAGMCYGKSNEFPIQDEAQRCSLPEQDLNREFPKLLDPCVQADTELLAHGIDGEVKPTASLGTWEYQRARYTIDLLGFNEWNTPEIKRNAWRVLDDLIRCAGNHPAVISHLQEHLSTNHEYTGFFRAAIGTHRDKPWVEGLL
ncbi:hypothetical protein J2N90_17765 [Enterobacter asburiae]|nr:hypothetical protein [Enterobacter asburiae]